MKYYKFPDYIDNWPGPGEKMAYVEARDGITFRMLIILENEHVSSNIDEGKGLVLPEGKITVDYEDDEEVIPITKEEFEQRWNVHLEKHRARWEETKKAFPIGKQVAGIIRIFYPQGVLVELEHNALGIADYAESLASTKSEFMQSRQRISGTVQGYDEVNQWVILGSPQVHKDYVPYRPPSAPK